MGRTIDPAVAKVRSAVYGAEVRESIAVSMEETYDACEAFRKDAEKSAASADESAKRAETEKSIAENAKASAAGSAESAEKSAKAAAESADSAAASEESSKKSANESAQSAADSKGYAETAKQYSGKPPTVIYGTWWIWDADEQVYKDTGIKATSLIDENSGNEVRVWFGTVAEYNALPSIEPDVYYNILEGEP